MEVIFIIFFVQSFVIAVKITLLGLVVNFKKVYTSFIVLCCILDVEFEEVKDKVESMFVQVLKMKHAVLFFFPYFKQIARELFLLLNQLVRQ